MASSSTSSSYPLIPAFSSRFWKYHVFLSFRGVDTRKNFVDHLYKAFLQRGISTYKDDVTLPRGELIRRSLMKAIEDSYIAVIVFSKNYANSSWCLDELSYIMKCRDTRGLIVIPVFHNVKPSMVRTPNQKYGEAFFEHKLKNEKKKSWRKALVYASNISGFETKKIANGHEAKCIDVIVDTITERLHQDASNANTSNLNDTLVGMEVRMEGIISALELGLGGVCMVGIWGVGGGGKTTLASSVYDQIYGMFDCCCFVKNIREESSKKNGLEKLQEKMLSGLLKQKQVHLRGIEDGRHMIMDEFHHKKVLLVLDDVDRLDQLEALAGSHDWFGKGSRIIITTRDSHLLTAHRINVTYTISLLNDDEAMLLFRKHAPRGHRPVEAYERLSEDVVLYTGGLPLALRVLSRFLCDKDMNEWRSALDRLKDIPDKHILGKLQISFDGLEPLEKTLFLNIARVFRGEHTHEGVMTMLDDWGFHHVRAIKVLIRKGLISLSDGKLVMHDLLKEMAHYINREQQHNNPDKRSRVWRKEDDLNMCATEDATKVGANMKKRRWFDLNFGRRDKATCSLPEKFQQRECSDLTFSELVQKQLWEAYKASDSGTLLPQTNGIYYHNSQTLGDYNISNAYDLATNSGSGSGYDTDTDTDFDSESDDEDGDTEVPIPVPKERKKNDKIEREINLKRLEKGKNKVDVDQMETLDNRIEGFFHKRMENKMVEMMENKMLEMVGMVVNRVVERLTDKNVEIEGVGVVQRMERLTNKMVEVEEAVMETMERLKNRIVEMEHEQTIK